MDEPNQEHLRSHFASLVTEELIRLHQSDEVIASAIPLLNEELARRGIDVRKTGIATEVTQGPNWLFRAKRKAATWAQRFALIGAGFAVLATTLASLYNTMPALIQPFALPAYFIFVLSDWRGEIGPVVLLAVAANSIAWAGFGWILGYGFSRNAKQ